MKKTLSFCDFCDEFKGSQYENNFTYKGKRALFEYLCYYEESTGDELECNIVSFCCDFTEYESFEDIKKQYPNIETIEELEDTTQVIEFDSGIIIQNF